MFSQYPTCSPAPIHWPLRNRFTLTKSHAAFAYCREARRRSRALISGQKKPANRKMRHRKESQFLNGGFRLDVATTPIW